MNDKFKNFLSAARSNADNILRITSDVARQVRQHINENEVGWRRQAKEGAKATEEYVIAAKKRAEEEIKGLYSAFAYSKERLQELENNVVSQGALYREQLRERRLMDTLVIGGETLAVLIAAGSVPDDVEAAFHAAYPNLADEESFLDRVSDLNEEQLTGFLAGVKGKLFEQQYVEKLNSGLLPDGYEAQIAESATQAGWDIAIVGPNEEIVSQLQAKATDSVSYVREALERYPSIDVVTTDEVYSHLVMSGIGEEIANSSISNVELTEYVEDAAGSADLEFDFMPPVLTLAFIAFTSYKDGNLGLYEKARSAGERSGKAYIAYLIGGGVAAITNTWWLGVLGTVSSRYLGDEGLRRAKLIETLTTTYKTNQKILDNMKRSTAPVTTFEK